MRKRDWQTGPTGGLKGDHGRDHGPCLRTLTSAMACESYEEDRGRVWKEMATINADLPPRDRPSPSPCWFSGKIRLFCWLNTQIYELFSDIVFIGYLPTVVVT